MNQTRLHLFLALLICSGCLLFVAFSVGSQVPEVKVVVNPSVDSKDLSVEQIRRIFSMRQTTWSNDQTITVYVLANQHQTHQVFSTKVLGMFPYQLDRIWNKLVYSGLGEEPIKLQSEEEMLERVSQEPGAIGYVMQPINLDKINVIKVLEK
ncbi:substrate-binding domain-containing protein [Paraglaciecola arctica]|uniref:substrate-binding domain-containing protein n=1 Tax=Paraglaciecola arctica TaxID=1128911 RepID=UPI0020910C5C|nr:substrate-binding domain-containing protein [Paraglaciecola arctica]